jgi:hypothetical protein
MKGVILAVCAMSAVAVASPAYPFDELLRRSETVFIGELGKHDATSVTFTVKQTLRGQPSARFDFDPVNGELPSGVTEYVVISQGDDVGGKPTARATLGQGTVGQVSFRGWIVLPVVNGKVVGAMVMGKTMAPVKLADVAKIVARSPYKPKG